MFLVLLGISFVLTFFGTFLIKKIALRKNILDIPNIRSSHSYPVPRGGGLAIAITWYIMISVLYILNNIPGSLYFSLICGIPVVVVGFLDDIIKIKPGIRFLIQISCACLGVFFLGGINSVQLGNIYIGSGAILNILAILGIVWFTNLFNFLDGIDGYISMEVIFVCISAYFLFNLELPLLMAATVSGFLLWNWQPAKIFMGDVGSTMLGFTIGIFTVYYQDYGQSSILIWIMLTSLFWFDATLTLYRRWRNKEQLSVAHKKHAYQRIVQSGFTHEKTVIYSLFINLIILLLAKLSLLFTNLILIAFIVNIILLYIIILYIDKKLPFR